MDLKEYVILVLQNAPSAYASRQFICKSASSYGSDKEIKALLEQMCEDGILLQRDDTYALVERLGLKRGTIVKVAGNFGFVELDDEEKTQVFVPGRFLRGGMTGELCLVKTFLSDKEGKEGTYEGDIVKLYKNEDAAFVGVLNITREGYSVTLDCMPKVNIRVWESSARKGKNGDKVLVNLVSRSDRHQNHVAAVLKVFGRSDRAKYCAEAVLADNDIETVFSKETAKEADALDRIGVEAEEVARRLDL
ncbi:MAG: hypothetical protein IIX77_05665, partial [Oscillospiraceae bacterium]|nr:hypothetical protein [Oscillospiraceae bacterium]